MKKQILLKIPNEDGQIFHKIFLLVKNFSLYDLRSTLIKETRKQTVFITLFTLFFTLPSYAASEGFPAREVFFQVFNFLLFATALFFLLRKPIQVFFHKRQEEFFAFEKQALQLEREKQIEKESWEKKIQTLNEQEKNIKQKAKEEGERFISQKKEEIKALKLRLKKEADFFLHLEREKSKRELFKTWKGKIIESAKIELKNQALSPSFQEEQLKGFYKQMEAHL